jgi:capsular polysaccharide biosynthesis protein
VSESEQELLPAPEVPEAVEPQLFPVPLDGLVRELAPLHAAPVELLPEVQEPALAVPEAPRRLPAAEVLEEEDRIQTLPRTHHSDRTIFQWPEAGTRLSPGT